MTEQTNDLPNVTLSGIDGNAYAIFASVEKAMKKHYGREEAKEIFAKYDAEAKSGDYDNVIQTTMRYCNVS